MWTIRDRSNRIVEIECSVKKSHLQKRLQPVSEAFRNGLYLTDTFNRGERIRTSGLLVPKQIEVLVETCGNERIFDAFD